MLGNVYGNGALAQRTSGNNLPKPFCWEGVWGGAWLLGQKVNLLLDRRLGTIWRPKNYFYAVA